MESVAHVQGGSGHSDKDNSFYDSNACFHRGGRVTVDPEANR
jgi:hypothetical protein